MLPHERFWGTRLHTEGTPWPAAEVYNIPCSNSVTLAPDVFILQ